MAQALSTTFLDLRHITGLTGSDLENNTATAKGFAPGQPMWMYDSQGLKVFTLVQIRASGTGSVTRGQVLSRCGGVQGVLETTVSTGTTTSVAHASNALVTNQWVGAICYLASTGSTAIATPESESSIVVSNSSTAININPLYPFSTTPGAGLLAELLATYQAEWASAGDVNSTVLGAVVAQNGITSGNFGFVQSFGPCTRVAKQTTTATPTVLLTGGQLAVGTASAVLCTSTAGALANLTVGRALAPASSVATDAMAFLNCGQFFWQRSTSTVDVI